MSKTLTTPVIGPAPLLVVWTLTLPSESEGPSLIACAARLHGFNRSYGLLSAPSWRTEADQLQTFEFAIGEMQLGIREFAWGVAFFVRRDFYDETHNVTS